MAVLPPIDDVADIPGELPLESLPPNAGRFDVAEAARRDAAEVLRADEARLRLAIAAAQLRTWEWDFATNEFTWSQRREDADEDISAADEAERRVAEGIVEEDQPGVQDAMRNAFHDGRDFDHEFRMRTASGVRWVSARATVDRDADGNAVRMVGVAADVTDRHAVEDELRSSRAFLNSVVENIPIMVFVKDAADLRYVRVNRAGEELVGATREDMIGRDAFELFPDQGDDFTAHDREVLDGKVVVDIPTEVMATRDKGDRILHTRKIPILDEQGVPRYLVGISEDVTVQQSTQRALEQASEAANQANQAKSEFLSRMSHELRTPLNSVLGFAQLLAMDELTTEQTEHVGFISQAGNHLLDLINEVLDIARIESGQLRLSLEPVHVADAIHAALDLVGPKARQLGVTITVASDQWDTHVVADNQRLMQVLLNLLSNALKYNRPGGRVSVDCACADGTVTMAVGDTGIGITPQNVAKLFTPFERLGAEHTDIEGSGVGLALSRDLVQQMGGTLEVVSTIGIGSTFTVSLPAVTPVVAPTPAEGASRPTMSVSSTDAVRVLYIEDNVANVRLIERAFSRQVGVQLMVAVQGHLGLELAIEHQPDLVMLDLHLPDMGGDELLRRLRAEPATAAIPVVMCSADASPGQIRRLLELGAAAYLTKPLDLAHLFDLIDRVRTGRSLATDHRPPGFPRD